MQKERLYGNGYNCLDVLLEQENYMDLITKAMDCIRENDDLCCWTSLGEVMLTHHSNKPTIIERQDNWVNQYIILNHSNIECMQFLFDAICNCSREQLFDAIRMFCKYNKSFEDFRLIHLVPTHLSWAGSEVPFIEKQIQFFEDLKNELLGFDYIEHRAYLSDYIKSYQQEKAAVLLKEFLENS